MSERFLWVHQGHPHVHVYSFVLFINTLCYSDFYGSLKPSDEYKIRFM